MLLVHHDQPGIGERREDGRARAEDHAGFARAGHGPGARAFALAQPGMQGQHLGRQPFPVTAQGLRCEGDLRHQHQRLAAAFKHARHQLQIDLGLAAAGDTLQQVPLETAVQVHGIHHRLLLGMQRRAGQRGCENACRAQRRLLHPAALAQAAYGRTCGRPELQAQLCQAQRSVGQGLEHNATRSRAQPAAGQRFGARRRKRQAGFVQ